MRKQKVKETCMGWPFGT